jgi:hypothetical protein
MKASQEKSLLSESQRFEQLTQLLELNPDIHAKAFNYRSSLISSFMHEYDEKHRVSPWPYIVDDAKLAQMKEVVAELPLILFKGLKFLSSLGNSEFCDFLDVSQVAKEFFDSYNFDQNDLPIRFDAIIESGVFKILEANCGGALGGWQMDWLYREVLSSLQDFEETSQWNLKHHHVCESLFKAVSRSMFRLKNKKSKGNVLFYMPNLSEENLRKIEAEFQKVYELSRPKNLDFGNVFFITDLDKFSINEQGYIHCRDEEMDAFILAIEDAADISEKLYSQVQSAALKKQFYYPDDSSLVLHGNKHLFSLVHRADFQSCLSDPEIELINKYMPWSSKLGVEEVCFQKKRYDTREFLKERQHDLVLKKSKSAGGDDVIVGRSYSNTDWLSSIDQLIQDNDWLIQSYCDPDLIVSCDPVNGFGTYRMIWGFFSLSGTYGGSFLRGVHTKSEATVINSAAGATEFLVFEEQKRKNKVTI